MEYGGLPPRSKPLDVSFMLRFETQENVLQKAKKLPDKELYIKKLCCCFYMFVSCVYKCTDLHVGQGSHQDILGPKGTINNSFKVVKVHCSLFCGSIVYLCYSYRL